MAAYHLEALRRQRVIDRKHLALAKIADEKEEEERRLQEEIELRCKIQQEQDENRRREREEHLRQRGQGCKMRTDKQVQVKMLSQKDLRYQSKILRDHGLVMGHVNDRFHS